MIFCRLSQSWMETAKTSGLIFRICEIFEFFADDCVVSHWIVRFRGNAVKEHFCPLNMLQELYTQPFAAGRAFDEARDVSDDKVSQDAEIGLKRRERVVGNPDIGIGKFIEEA